MDRNVSPSPLQPRNPSLLTRLIYAGGALSVLPVTLVGSSGWVGLATGGMLIGQVGATLFLLIGAAILFRVYQVLRYPRALETRPAGWVAKGFRGLALVTMLVGGLAGIGLFMIRPITYALMKNPGENGIGFFVIGLSLAVVASAGWKGCVVYEIARLAGRAPKTTPHDSPYQWKQDAIVAVVLVAICVGVPAFQKATQPPRCEGIRIACVSVTQSEVKRMIALPLDTKVHFESSVKAIDLQDRSLGRVKWVLSENPAVSLRTSGYIPTSDIDTNVRVKIDVADSPNGVVMHLLVSEGSEQTARFTTTFSRGSKLERDEDGAVHIAIEAPSNIDTMIRGTYQDEHGQQYMVDQIYVQLRRAIGTEQEARENTLRLLRTARIRSEIEGVTKVAAAKSGSSSDNIDVRCADLVTVHRPGRARSDSPNDLGWPMPELRFTRSAAAPPPTNIHGFDRVICEGGNILIVSYSTVNPVFSLRRYSEDGKLLRFVQSPLPAPRREGYDFIDLTTLRESANAITFDRVGARYEGGKERFLRRESFEIPL